MKFSSFLSYLALGVSTAIAAPAVEIDIDRRANLPGLNALQTKYANVIIANAKAEGVGAHGCQAAIATAMVEVRSARYTLILRISAHYSLIIRDQYSLASSCTPTKQSPNLSNCPMIALVPTMIASVSSNSPLPSTRTSNVTWTPPALPVSSIRK